MTVKSSATESPSRRDTASLGRSLALAVFEASDFDRARAVVDGFDHWASFDDFVCERDGSYIGLSTAGEEAHLVPVSFGAFEQWATHSGVALSVQSLDDFAAVILAFRENPGLAVEGWPGVDGNRRVPERNRRNDRLYVPIASVLYRNWLETLAHLNMASPPPSVDDYARLLVESWAEYP
jgi:hypothetical protein